MSADVLADLASQHAELCGLIVDLPEEGWHAPTPCPGWDVTDVVLHLAQTDEAAIASAEGRLGVGPDGTLLGDRVADVDELAERMVVEARSMTAAAVLERWETATQRLRTVLDSTPPDRSDRAGSDRARGRPTGAGSTDRSARSRRCRRSGR